MANKISNTEGEEVAGARAAKQPDPMMWQEEINAFIAADSKTPPPGNSVVFTGSSSIAFWKSLRSDMEPLTVLQRGFGGSTLLEVQYWLDVVVMRYLPRAVVLYGGDNDIGHYDATADTVFGSFKRIVSTIHKKLPGCRIYYVSIKPSLMRWELWPEMREANRLIRQHCEVALLLRYIDVASSMLDERGRPICDFFEDDNLHLSARGYKLWAEVIKRVLLEYEFHHEVAS